MVLKKGGCLERLTNKTRLKNHGRLSELSLRPLVSVSQEPAFTLPMPKPRTETCRASSTFKAFCESSRGPEGCLIWVKIQRWFWAPNYGNSMEFLRLKSDYPFVFSFFGSHDLGKQCWKPMPKRFISVHFHRISALNQSP